MPTLYKLLNPNTIRLSDVMPMLEDEGEAPIDEISNRANREHVINNWNLGPEKASVDPKANTEYWAMMADVWKVEPEEARRMLCANCEYFCNAPEDLAMMEAVPLDAYDMDGGGRGYCEKFDFICHSLRVCQAWEPKEDEKED